MDCQHSAKDEDDGIHSEYDGQVGAGELLWQWARKVGLDSFDLLGMQFRQARREPAATKVADSQVMVS